MKVFEEVEEIVLDMRKMYKNGIHRKEIYEKYKHLISFSGLKDIIYNRNWKYLNKSILNA